MKKIILLAAVLFISLADITAQAWQQVGARGFSPPVTQNIVTALTIDHNGVPYVAFSDASDSGKMSVMKFNGAAWVYVGNADFSAGGGYDMSIAIDNNNLPWVAFGDQANNSRATVMKFNGTSWVYVGAAGFSAGTVNNCTINFDGSYTPYIAYVDYYYSDRAVVEKFNGTNWVAVGTPGFTAGGTGQMTMAMSRSGEPYVGYQDQVNGFEESVMMYNGANWVHVGAATFSAGTIQYTHITFDTSGAVPYVSYNAGSGTFSPNVQKYINGGWQYVGGQNLNNDGDYLNNIVIGINNTPYVIFPDGSYNYRATVVNYNGSWTTVGSQGFSGGAEVQFPNIAADAWGNIYAEYYDSGDSDKVSVMKFGNFGPPNNVTANFTVADTAVCQNSPVIFTDQSTGAPTSWQWTFTGGTPDTSSSQNPTIVYNTPGSYNVKLVASNSNGADSITKTSYITVLAPPVAGTVSANPDTICFGGVTQLSVTGDTGTIQWQSSLYPYSFANISGAHAATYNTSAITLNTYFRVLASNNVCGADSSNIQMVFVTPSPLVGTILTETDTVCINTVVNLATSGSIANTFEWQYSTGNGYTAISDDDTTAYITPPLSQTTTYRLIAMNGTCADTAAPVTISVDSVPAPVLSANDTLICPSDSALIQTSGSYSSYAWNNDDTSAYIYAKNPGGYWVSVTDAYGCPAVSNHQNISVYPLPSVSTQLRGDTLFSLNATSYQWYNDSGAISNAKDSVYIVRETGNYWVQITDSNGCTAQSQVQHVIISGITEIDNNIQVSIYPNPFNSYLFIQQNRQGPIWGSIEIYDATGRMMQDIQGNASVSGTTKINAANLAEGIYYLKIQTGQGVQVWKIVKQ